MTFTFGSLFSGIGGFDLGFERAGMECRWQVEIDDKASAVLERHWPNTPRHKDVRYVGSANLIPVDVVCGGFPCQDLSITGKRAGLAGERSGLWFEFYRILAELRPRYAIIENVPGLLSSNRGADFAVILRGLAELGYFTAWRVLDAQYFGVAQRRRRVFIVGSLGTGRAAEVLFESEGMQGDLDASEEAQQDDPEEISGSPRDGRVAGTLTASAGGLSRPRGNSNELDFCIVGTLDRKSASAARGSQSNETEFIVPEPFKKQAFGYYKEGDISSTLNVGVRRLTPTECERLQGFPDGWTAMGVATQKGDTERDLPWHDQSDSARYRQLGNAVAVPVAEWIGRQIIQAMERTNGTNNRNP